MTAGALAVVAASILAAAVVSTISGFGFALLSVPLMTLAVDTHTAVVVSTLTGVIVTLNQAWRQRAHADAALVKRMTLASYAGMPFGLLIFTAVSGRVLLRILGLAVLVAVVLLLAGLDLSRRGRSVDLVAGFVAGVLGTSISTNGPPLVFALQARRLTADAFRGTILTVFALCNVGAIALFLAAGAVTREGLVASAVSVPALTAGQLIGRPLRPRIQGPRFRALVLVMLTAAGGRALLASF